MRIRYRDDLHRLPFLTSCIKEALRLHSVIPIIQRVTTRDTTLDGHVIPAATLVHVNLYVMHHNSHVWDKPFVSTLHQSYCRCVNSCVKLCIDGRMIDWQEKKLQSQIEFIQ